jgi:hypothetical protein
MDVLALKIYKKQRLQTCNWSFCLSVHDFRSKRFHKIDSRPSTRTAGAAMFTQASPSMASWKFRHTFRQEQKNKRRGPFLTSPLGLNLTPRGELCPLGVKLSPGGEILCLPLHYSKQ